MKKTEKENNTSNEAKKAGLRRISRKHSLKKGEAKLSDSKVRITINLDADVLEYFKKRAESPNAAPYQTQINAELRKVMGTNSADSLEMTAKSLLQDEEFISALKEKLKAA
ncbi:MAG: BrnA antitoxin family protein [Acidobacteria bacterium]|nr:BrnA antitoxin family protein [Acidobacteriota bacterium]